MGSEIACINTCVLGQPPIVTLLNYLLIGAIFLAGFLLIFFNKKLSLKANLQLKVLMLSAIFSLLAVLLFAQGHQTSLFSAAHTAIFFLIIIFFAISYLFASFIARIGLETAHDLKIDEIVKEEAAAVGLAAPQAYVFKDENKIAFAVSALQKSIFISTGAVSSLEEKELKAVIRHELMHLKSGFFNLKRFLYSVKAGFLGLLPISLDELETLEEMRLDNELEKEGINIKAVREKF